MNKVHTVYDQVNKIQQKNHGIFSIDRIKAGRFVVVAYAYYCKLFANCFNRIHLCWFLYYSIEAETVIRSVDASSLA